MRRVTKRQSRACRCRVLRSVLRWSCQGFDSRELALSTAQRRPRRIDGFGWSEPYVMLFPLPRAPLLNRYKCRSPPSCALPPATKQFRRGPGCYRNATVYPRTRPSRLVVKQRRNRIANGERTICLAPPAGLEPALPVPETGVRYHPLEHAKGQVRGLRALSKAISIRLRIWVY